MMKKIASYLTISMLTLALFFPGVTVADICYNYEYTKTGLGVDDIGGGVFQIREEKSTFTTNESVWVLSKLTSIQYLNTFRLRHDLYEDGTTLLTQLYSPTFYPGGDYWEMTFTWNEFGPLPAGNHTIKAYMSQNGGPFQEVDTKNITVAAAATQYDYVYTKTGLGVAPAGGDDYNIVDEQSVFSMSESVWALSKLTNIQNINSLRLRHDLLVNGTDLYAQLYSPTYNPNGSFWASIYSWNEFGPLPAGDHIIKVYMSVEGGSYMEVDAVNITVEGSQSQYVYEYSKTGTGVDDLGGNEWQIIDEKSAFPPTVSVWVLSKLTGIQGMNSFRLRHDLIANGANLYKQLYTPTFYPDGGFWAKTYTWNEFGALPSGNHLIKVYISVNGGTYTEIDSLPIVVSDCTQPFAYDYTKTGLGVDDLGSGQFAINTEK